MTSPIRIITDETSLYRSSQIPYKRALKWQPIKTLITQNEPAVSIFVTQKAYIRFCAHSGTDLNNEVGGWLLGKYRIDRSSGDQFIVVDTILPAQQIIHGNAFLTFTQDSQVTLLNYVYDHLSTKDVLGWFHTHPRMGVFLSEYDTWLHENFFPELWQVALVIEPFSSSGGFFIRQKGNLLDPRNYYGFYELTNGKDRSVVHWKNMVTHNYLQAQGDIYE